MPLGGKSMSLAFQVDSLDGVEESHKAFYQEKEGKFVLNVEGLPEPPKGNDDVDGLKAKNGELLTELKGFKKKSKDAEDAAATARLEAAKQSGDTEAFGKSWQEKYNNRESELLSIIAGQEKSITSVTSGNVAARLAGDLALDLGNGETTAKTLEQLILSRLKTETRDGVPKTIVLDMAGQPTALTVDEFKKEFAAMPSIAPLIAGSKASGGGANGSNNSGGAANEKSLSRSQFDQLDASKKMEFSKSGGSITDD